MEWLPGELFPYVGPFVLHNYIWLVATARGPIYINIFIYDILDMNCIIFQVCERASSNGFISLADSHHASNVHSSFSFRSVRGQELVRSSN
jgi:hypothetical protein